MITNVIEIYLLCLQIFIIRKFHNIKSTYENMCRWKVIDINMEYSLYSSNHE